MDKKDSSLIDLLGISASIICILHCLLTSIGLIFLPHFSQKLLNSEYTHQILALFAMFFCLASAYQCYKNNFDKKPLILFLTGLICLFSVTFVLPEQLNDKYELYILGSGALALISGHAYNFKRLCHCRV